MIDKRWITGCGAILLLLATAERSAGFAQSSEVSVDERLVEFDDRNSPAASDLPDAGDAPTPLEPLPDSEVETAPGRYPPRHSPADVAGKTIGVWLCVAVFYLVIGRRQVVEAGGTMRRLAWVAPLAAAIAVGPLWVWAFAERFLTTGADETLVVSLSTLSFMWMALTMRPPLKAFPIGAAQPLVLDEKINASIASVAAAMRIAPPRLRIHQIVGGAGKILAFAGGLPQPSIIVTSGALHRLSPVERDAILAHEMAHIANHSLWPLLAIFPATCAVIVWASCQHPFGLAMLLGILFGMGLRRVVSRTFEADCDRRAARVVGFPQTIAALYKVHAAHVVRNRGWLSLLAYSMATHPSREVRLSLLVRAFRRERGSEAPSDPAALSGSVELAETGGVAFVYSARRFWVHRLMSWLGLTVWASVLILSWQTVEEKPLLPLVITIVAPSLLLSTAIKPEERRRAKRGRVRGARSWWERGKFVLMIFAIAFFSSLLIAIADFDNPIVLPAIVACLIGVLALWIVRHQRSPQRKLLRAIAEHDFAEALRIGESNPKLRQDPSMKYNLALTELIAGDRDRGIAELEELTAKYPQFRLPSIALCMALVDSGQAERAWQVASAAVRQTPKDPLPHAETARALRSLGRHEAAQVAAERALVLDGDCALAESLLGGIALDSGLPDKAFRHVAAALDLAPGDAFAHAIQAEIHLATGDLEAAGLGFKAAMTAATANPFMLMRGQLARLEQRIATAKAAQSLSNNSGAEITT